MKALHVLIAAALLWVAQPPCAMAEDIMGDLPSKDGAEAGKPVGEKNGKPGKGENSPKCAGLVNMSNGLVLPAGKYSLSLKHVFVHKDNLYDGQEKKTGNYNGKYERTDHITTLTAKAGLFDNFEARVQVPWYNREQKQKSGNPPSHFATVHNEGLGDIIAMGRYALLNQRLGDPFSLAVGAGLSIPTGDTDKRSPQGGAGSHPYMGPNFQLGTGTWDPKFELGATKILGRSRFDFHTMYTISGDGPHGSRAGNVFKYDFGYGYALNKYFDVELEVNGIDHESCRHDHASTLNTGGHFVFITPGVHWKITESSRLALGVPINVYRNMRGETRTPDRASQYGLYEDYRIVTSLSFQF